MDKASTQMDKASHLISESQHTHTAPDVLPVVAVVLDEVLHCHALLGPDVGVVQVWRTRVQRGKCDVSMMMMVVGMVMVKWVGR
jgi:hypothetical protein